MELGKTGVGHFWGNDKWICDGGVRDWMKIKYVQKVMRQMSFGDMQINLKERVYPFFLSKKHLFLEKTQKQFERTRNMQIWNKKKDRNFKILDFKTAWEECGGDGSYYLWIANRGKNFKYD